ncbi:MAG: hypothetical protein FJ399_12535 [Verrucomicrobia bacterium]|nr:hypothetical protein [Verrucomicrobiota bacterium]
MPDGSPSPEATRLRELSPQQWKSGLAAWLGWLFDGLELHLYTLVATPLVVQLLPAASAADPAVKEKSAWIQAAFLVGWALGGALFGRLGDVLGRSRALAGVVPALLVFYIRRHVPEPATWQRAEESVHHRNPGARELFRGRIVSTTVRTTLVCALGLSAWWLFMFWHPQYFRQLLAAEGVPTGEMTRLVSSAFFLVNLLAIAGNFGDRRGNLPPGADTIQHPEF